MQKINFEELKHQNILCIGDIMLDKFVYGKVNRISPEAPVQVFEYKEAKEMLGGCGNVVANLVSLGCNANYIGIVGDDENGKKISKLLNKINCHYHLLKLDSLRTIVKTRIIANHNHILRIDKEEQLPIIEDLIPKFKKILDRAIKNADIVILSDYAKGVLTDFTTPMIIDICDKYHKRVIVDPKGDNYKKYRGAFFVKPNLKEFLEATDKKIDINKKNYKNEIIKSAKKLFSETGIQNLLITLSEHGMVYISSNKPNNIIHMPTMAKEVFDVSGAGDTTIAAFTAALSLDCDIETAMQFANIAAGIAVGKLGTACVSKEEMSIELNSLSSKNKFSQKSKIITLEQAKIISKNLKDKGYAIGFTNGCFDLLHLGHLHSFVGAKQNCDYLFVGLNSDSSIKRLKGDSRPIQDEKTRSYLLASLEFIDYIVIFDDDTAMPLIDAIRPDIIAKEGYKIEDWPEAQKVIEYGGKAISLDRLEGYSTSNSVKKILQGV